MNNHIFTYKHDEVEITYTINNVDLDIHELMDHFGSYLLSCGFHPDTIKEYINEER